MTTEEFFNFALPKHPQGEIGMIRSVRDLGKEIGDDKLVNDCNQELARFN